MAATRLPQMAARRCCGGLLASLNRNVQNTFAISTRKRNCILKTLYDPHTFVYYQHYPLVTLSKHFQDEDHLKVKREYFDISFSKSSGPGGQNVNKVNSKVLLRFNVNNATWLPEQVKEDLLLQESGRINKNGEMIIASNRYRTQLSNVNDALMKVQLIIDRLTAPVNEPTVEKQERIKEQIDQAKEIRIQRKKQKSEKKQDRRDDF